jgi:hypothetical protein
MAGEGITGVVSTAVDAMRSTQNTRIREQQHMELVLAILKNCAPAALGGTKEP